jgi:hypothetical protein
VVSCLGACLLEDVAHIQRIADQFLFVRNVPLITVVSSRVLRVLLFLIILLLDFLNCRTVLFSDHT